MPQLRFVLTDAAFELSRLYMERIVAYVGLPLIGGMVGFLRISVSLLTEVAAMVGEGGGGLINN